MPKTSLSIVGSWDYTRAISFICVSVTSPSRSEPVLTPTSPRHLCHWHLLHDVRERQTIDGDIPRQHFANLPRSRSHCRRDLWSCFLGCGKPLSLDADVDHTGGTDMDLYRHILSILPSRNTSATVCPWVRVSRLKCPRSNGSARGRIAVILFVFDPCAGATAEEMLGLGVSMARSSISNAILFSSFEYLKKKINSLEDPVPDGSKD